METPPTPPVPAPIDTTGADDTALLRDSAAELAKEDSRREARTEDHVEAVRGLTAPTADAAQEVPAGDEGLVTWNSSPDEAGHRAPETTSDDEADDSADLAEEGSGEAEKELRRAARQAVSNPQPPLD